MDLIILLKAIVLGIIEGVTEFIPVSSTGHLILAQNWLNFIGHKENAFLIFIQLGAILAVVWVYRQKFLNVTLNLHRDAQSQRLVINMIIATIPAVVIGLPTEDWIESHLFKPLPVALALLLGGVAILLIERRRQKISVESVDDIPVIKALWVGLFQVLAILFPGVSRSGATIMGGLVLGLSRKASTEFSFFLAIPAMFGATLIKLYKVREILSANDIPLFAVGFVVSFIAALLVIKGLLALVSRRSFIPFAWYRIVFGAALLIGFWYFNVGF
jgi:undecaprenyl-diphosphatase